MATTGGGEDEPRLPLGNPEEQNAEASLNLAEELFVSCRFTEAARVCDTALTEVDRDRLRPPTRGKPYQGNLLASEDGTIAPLGECTTADLLVAVLLQCGFELGRSEHWARCREYYKVKGPIPFAIAMLWLRLRLASGETDVAQRNLRSLRSILGSRLRFILSVLDQNPSMDFGAVYANYSEVMDVLILQDMLPSFDCADASSIVASDPYLEAQQKSRLLDACEAAIRERESKGDACGVDEDRDGDPLARQSWRATDDAESNRHASELPLRRERSLNDSTMAQRVFNDLPEWTPETRLRLVLGVGAAGLALYTACRRRDTLWRVVRNVAGVARRTVGDVGTFIVGSS